jgi:hypothetical protein
MEVVQFIWFVLQVGSDVYLCYKKSMNRANLIPYKPGECCTVDQITGEVVILWHQIVMLLNSNSVVSTFSASPDT